MKYRPPQEGMYYPPPVPQNMGPYPMMGPPGPMMQMPMYMPQYPQMVPPQEKATAQPQPQMNLPNDKELLGELLYNLVEKKNPEMASKITGMLLEMDVDQIHNIIKDTNQLNKWIDEAIKVIFIHFCKNDRF